MDSFHRHLDELERLLSDADMKERRIKESVLCYAAYLGFNPMVEALIQKGVGKEYYNENHSMSVETGMILVTDVAVFHLDHTITRKMLLLNYCLCQACLHFVDKFGTYKMCTSPTRLT